VIGPTGPQNALQTTILVELQRDSLFSLTDSI
jgi:hypothetical protein